MELEAPPLIVYTVREVNSDLKVIKEHIFIGNLLDNETIEQLNSGRKDPSHKEVKALFKQFNIQYNQEKMIQTYHPMMIEFNDSWNDVYYKIRQSTNILDSYIWNTELKESLSHQFYYKGNKLDINPDPFTYQEDLDNLFSTYGSLKLENNLGFLVRKWLTPNQKVLNLISGKTLLTLAKDFVGNKNINVFLYRFQPPEIQIRKPYYNLVETQCLNSLIRNQLLPINDYKVNIDLFYIEQCTIHINPNDDESFINLYTIFQLITLDDELVFAKIKKGERGISKISKSINKFKSQISKDQLTEWSNIEEYPRGLLYRKLKKTPGLVIYKFYDNGFIELQINWTKSTDKDQFIEIINEIKELNNLIKRIHKINYQTPGYSDKIIPFGDEQFLGSPLSDTKITYFNFKTYINTNKQQISWNAFNYLIGIFDTYFSPVFNWKIYNQKELQKEVTGVNQTNIHYLKTNNNLRPEKIHSILFSLGLVGLIYKEQTVTVERQKDIIVEDAKLFTDDPDFTREDLEEKIREIKNNNVGVLINIKYENDMYTIDVKGAHNIWEIREINFLINLSIKYYFHIGNVYKYIKNYNCGSLKSILELSERIDTENVLDNYTIDERNEIMEETVDVFDVEGIDEDEFDVEPAGSTEYTGITSEESIIPKDLAEIPEEDEVDITGAKKTKSVLEYLKDVSGIFKTEYRRHGCTTNIPTVMSSNDFWHNYRRLIKRFEVFKAELKEKDSLEYDKKFQKDLEMKDPSLDKFKKRVEYVAKKIGISSQKKLLLEIADIVDRYHKGALLKVPLDKKRTQYSKEYFYFCPFKWCLFCRESRLSDEISNNTCKICENELYTLPNPKNSFIGFPSSKKYPHINCLPCCFINENKFKKKVAECNISHPVKKISKVVEKSKPNLSKILTGDIITFDRYGHLDGEISGKLNDFFNNGLIIDKIKNNQEVYLLKGVNQVGEKDAFLEAISYFHSPQDPRRRPTELRQHLVDSIQFTTLLTLNNGLIATLFKTPENTWDEALDDFKLHLSTEPLTEDILWHFAGSPGILLDEGYNLLIIKRSSTGNKENKYTMLCPPGLRMTDYFDPSKLTAIILKLDNNIYYPIVLVSCHVDFDDGVSLTKSPEEFKLFSNSDNPFIRDLFSYAVENCQIPSNKYEKNIMDLNQTINELIKTTYLNKKKLTVVMNPYYQINNIILKINLNNKKKLFFLPIKPSPVPYEHSPIHQYFEELDPKEYFIPTEEELFTVAEVLQILKELIKLTNIPIKMISFVMDSNQIVYGIKLENNTIIRFKEISINNFSNKNLPIIQEAYSYNVDLSIIGKHFSEEDERLMYVNRTTFQKESFQRLRFELSRNIFSNKELKDNIIDILESNKNIKQKRSEIEKIIKPVINSISFIGNPNLKEYKIPQIRTICQNSNCLDQHCSIDPVDKQCKVVLPKILILPNNITKQNSINRYVVLITDEILRNAIKRSEMLEGKVSIYVNPSQMVYHIDKEIIITDTNYQLNISELYSKSVDYLDLLQRHYYIESSEVFTREVEQNLHYFSDDNWYKNTGLSRNDYVINIKNTYELLNEVLGEDIGEQLWNFIHNNSWKIWLNAFKSLLQDDYNNEYQNIYQYSQFMEHIKYGKSTLSDIHLSLISRLNNIKFIIMNKTAIGSRKFHCIGTTQAHSSTKTYMILYRYDNENLYLVGKTPHLDLTNEKDIQYIFKEEQIPTKFFKIWYEQCKEDHKIQKKPDPADFLIQDIEKIEDYGSFIDDLSTTPDITKEKIIRPPNMKKPMPPVTYSSEKRSRSRSRSKSPPKISFKKKESKKEISPLKFKPRPKNNAKSNDNSPSPSPRGRPRSRSISKDKKDNKPGKARSVSPQKRGRSRSPSKKKSRSKSVPAKKRSRSTSRTQVKKLLSRKSRNKSPPPKLTFKKKQPPQKLTFKKRK